MHPTTKIDSASGPHTRGRIGTRLRPLPAERYVHPKAEGLVNLEAEHSANIDVAADNAPNYLNWIADRCRPHLGQRVLEVGAGIGSITERYAPGREVLAIERSRWCIEELEKRFAQTPNVTVRHADLVELFGEEQRYDSIVMINVLEHIEDDVAALASLRQLLVPGGRVVLYIPALNGLYGPWDRKVGHYRRYSKWRMRRVLDAAGLVEVDLRYMNSLSIPAWWIFSHGNVERSVAGRLNLWDKTGVPLGRLIESVIPPPLGCNVFCVARSKDEPTTKDG